MPYKPAKMPFVRTRLRGEVDFYITTMAWKRVHQIPRYYGSNEVSTLYGIVTSINHQPLPKPPKKIWSGQGLVFNVNIEPLTSSSI